MLFQTSVGIDIQDRILGLTLIKGSSRNVQLVAHATYPLSDESSERKMDAILTHVRTFMRENRISPAAVFMSIPRNIAIIRYLELPVAVKENLGQTLGYEMEKFIPLSTEDIYFDFQVIAENKELNQLKVLLVVVKKETLNPYLTLAGQLGVGITGIEISSTALAEYFSYQAGKNSGKTFAFIYLSGMSSEFGLLQNGALAYSRAFDEETGNEEPAETLLCEVEKMQQARGEADTHLEIAVCVADENSPFLGLLDQATDLHIHPLDLSKAKIPSIGIIPAYGLALKGVQKARMGINLLPMRLRKKPSKWGHYTLFFLAGLALLTAFAWGGGTVLRHQWTLDRLDKEISELNAQAKEIEKVREEMGVLEERIGYLSTLQQGGAPVLDILKELSIRIPEDAWVRQFNFSEKGITIAGEAASASELIPLLEDSPIFENVAFLSTITKARNGKERFRIGLSLN